MPSALKFTTALMAIALVSLSSGCVSQTALTAAQKEAALIEGQRQALEDQNALLRDQIHILQEDLATVAAAQPMATAQPTTPTVTPVIPTTTFAGPNGELVMTKEVMGPKTLHGSLGGTETFVLRGMELNADGQIIFPGGELLPMEQLKKAGPSERPHPIVKGKEGTLECRVNEYQSCQPPIPTAVLVTTN